jgi:hypothetical protein
MNTQAKPYVLVLGGEFPLRERVLAGALRASDGLPIYTLAKARTSTTIKFFDGYIVGDVSDPQGVLNAVQQHELEHGATPAAIIPMNDFTVRSALAVSQHYGLHHNPAETVHKCRDKFLMKQILAAAGLPVPRFGAFSSFEELQTLAGEIGFPLVIKPRELAGSVGVIKVSNPAELRSAYEQCIADIKVLDGAYMTPEDVFQAEEYIPAKNEVSVEVANHGPIHRVLAVTDKYLGPEPYFVETGHSVPSVHTGNKALVQIAERACEALGIRYGIALRGPHHADRRDSHHRGGRAHRRRRHHGPRGACLRHQSLRNPRRLVSWKAAGPAGRTAGCARAGRGVVPEGRRRGDPECEDPQVAARHDRQHANHRQAERCVRAPDLVARA